jgi:caffeoyl-CoA O-methyltransferase
MDFLPAALAQYVEAHTEPEPPLLRQLSRATHQRVLRPRMLSGHVQGRLLALLSQLVRPRLALEIGTYTGYSALCLAEGLTDDGRLITIDPNDELEPLARQHWAQSPVGHKIDFRAGRAVDILPTLAGPFDLVFIDADKANNSLYVDLVIDKVRPGGLLLIDNVLWSGKVTEPLKPTDKDTPLVLAFNARIQADPRLENVLLPIRDGLMLTRKR